MKKSIKLDYHTFGGTEASETLAFMLTTKYPMCIHKVSSYYHQYNRDVTNMMYAWKHFKNGGLLELMELHKQKKFSVINNSNLPAEVKSFLLNVMSVSYYAKRKVVKNLLKENE